MEPRVIAITGGPAGGKSKILEAIIDEYGHKLLSIGEMATMLLTHGYCIDSLEDFQEVILFNQVRIINSAVRKAKKEGIPFIICDRGELDGGAYPKGGRNAFVDMFGLDLTKVMSNYFLVLHLESLASGNPDLYMKVLESNPARQEKTVPEALAVEMATRKAWEGHPNWHFVPNSGSLEELKARVFSILSTYFDVEIERKFVLPGIPAIDLPKAKIIRQVYASTSPGEIRLREENGVVNLCTKGEGATSRKEKYVNWPHWFFDDHWGTDEPRIEKDRYVIEVGDLLWELDVYHGKLEGLVTLECELPDENLDIVLPDWAKGAIEVTDDPRYKNKNMAVHGLPK